MSPTRTNLKEKSMATLSKNDVIIVGGGVIGLACAHYLNEAGVGVHVIDRKKVGQGASHGNCGLLYFSDVIPLCSPGTVSYELIRTVKGTSPLYIKPDLDIGKYLWLLKFALQCKRSHMKQASKAKVEILMYSMGLFKTLLSSSPLPCDFEDVGILTVFKEKKNFTSHVQTQKFLEGFGVQAEKIEKAQLKEVEPALRSDLAGAWLNKVDWHLRPDLFMKSWHKRLEKKGVIFHENCEVVDFTMKNNRVDQVHTRRGSFQAEEVILAAGAWTPKITKKLDLNLPVLPGKGYSITMERPEICPRYPCSLYEKNMVVTPWQSAYRLGGTMEFSGYSDALNRKRLNKLITGAKAYLKQPLGDPRIEEWTGLRPMTYDDMPVIDRVGRLNNLIVATGHGMLGVTLATGTGKTVCDMVLGRPTEIDMTPYSLKRFT
jgi:D-amino-acid dehydrogenase